MICIPVYIIEYKLQNSTVAEIKEPACRLGLGKAQPE